MCRVTLCSNINIPVRDQLVTAVNVEGISLQKDSFTRMFHVGHVQANTVVNLEN